LSISVAGYGGEGRGYDGTLRSVGHPYGSVTAPVDLGSGGAGGKGGGAAILEVSGTTTVYGKVLANAQNISKTGSGGSIFLTTGLMAGTGLLQCTSYGYGGAGGGGRIAVVLTNDTSFGSVQMDANGGAGGGYNAGGGTVYLKKADQTYGDLIIDNHDLATTSKTRITSNVTDAIVGTVDIRTDGQLQVDAGQELSVHGSWTNAGGFTAGAGGTVEFAGTNMATVIGSTIFGNLVITTATKRVDFEAGSTFTVSNSLTLAGAASATNDFNSTSPGTQWNLTLLAGAAQSVSYCAVQDSNADGGDPIGAVYCQDDGSNSNWVFAIPGPIVWIGATNTDWNNKGNWDLGRPPVPLDTQITISNGANQPLLDNNREIGGDLIISSGANLTCNGKNLTVKGDTDINGTLTTSASETLTFEGNVDFTGGTFVRAQSQVDISGTDTQTLTAAGQAFNTLQIVNGAAMVTLNSGLSANDLICDVAGASLEFEAGQSVAVTNLRLTGTSENRITLRSTLNGSQWDLNVSGWHSVFHVDAKDSDATGGNTIYAMHSTNSLNNDNWDFMDWEIWTGGTSSEFTNSANWSDASAPTTNSYVLLDGNGANAPIISSATTVRRLTIGTTQSSTLTINTNLTVSEDVFIQEGGTLTHSANPVGTAEPYKIRLTIGGDLTILAGGSIDATAKGFPANNGPGKTSNPNGGAAHGGQGEGYTNPNYVPVGKCYGSFLQPVNLGSGGAARAGGGAIRLIVAGTADILGSILAEGDSDNAGFRTGSGGSIWITADTMTGTGCMSVASYGNASGGGAGGGGRLAVELISGTDFGNVDFSAKGGYTGYRGAAGSIYLKHAADSTGRVIIDNEDVPQYVTMTELPPSTNAVAQELRTIPVIVTNTAWVLLPEDAWVGDILIYTDSAMTLSNFYLHVNSKEHSLEDLADNHPDASTNRVDHYDQILWEGLPPGTVLMFR